jgi:predicted ATPase
MMSMGTQRIVWLLTNVIIAEAYDAQCIGIEEVETSIHPKMLGELLELLDENIGETSLLITSHSPFLIQYLKPQQIYIGEPSDNGIARFKRIREDEVEKINSYAHDRGLGFGEYLFELMSSDSDGSAMLASVLEG